MYCIPRRRVRKGTTRNLIENVRKINFTLIQIVNKSNVKLHYDTRHMFVCTVSSYSFLSGDINEFFDMFFKQSPPLPTPTIPIYISILFVIALSFPYYFFVFYRFLFCDIRGKRRS